MLYSVLVLLYYHIVSTVSITCRNCMFKGSWSIFSLLIVRVQTLKLLTCEMTLVCANSHYAFFCFFNDFFILFTFDENDFMSIFHKRLHLIWDVAFLCSVKYLLQWGVVCGLFTKAHSPGAIANIVKSRHLHAIKMN